MKIIVHSFRSPEEALKKCESLAQNKEFIFLFIPPNIESINPYLSDDPAYPSQPAKGVSCPFVVQKIEAFDIQDEASDTASGVGTAPAGRQIQALANVSGASGAPLRNGTTRPRRSRNTQGESLDPSSSSEPIQRGPAPTLRRERQRWTREMNVSLISAYFFVTEGETQTKKYAGKLAERWIESYPDKQFTGKHLVAQVKNIKTKNYWHQMK